MPTPKATCNDCEKRSPGCHSKCSDYLSFKKQKEEFNKMIYEKRREHDSAFYSFMSGHKYQDRATGKRYFFKTKGGYPEW